MRLSREDIEAIVAAVAPTVARAVAERVLALIDEDQANELVDAAVLARVLGVDREWVYEHADQLGAIRLGAGRRPGSDSRSVARWPRSERCRRSVWRALTSISR